MQTKFFLTSFLFFLLPSFNLLLGFQSPTKIPANEMSADGMTVEELKTLLEKRILTQLQKTTLEQGELDSTMRFVNQNSFSDQFNQTMLSISDDPAFSDYHRSKVILYLISNFLKSKRGSVRPEELREVFGKNRWYMDSEVQFKALMGMVLPDKLSKDHIHYHLLIPVGKYKISYIMRMIAQPPHEFDTPVHIEIAFYGKPKDPEWLKNNSAWQEWLKTHPGWSDKKPLFLIDGFMSTLLENKEN